MFDEVFAKPSSAPLPCARQPAVGKWGGRAKAPKITEKVMRENRTTPESDRCVAQSDCAPSGIEAKSSIAAAAGGSTKRRTILKAPHYRVMAEQYKTYDSGVKAGSRASTASKRDSGSGYRKAARIVQAAPCRAKKTNATSICCRPVQNEVVATNAKDI